MYDASRCKTEALLQFTGRYLYTLVLADGEFKIKSRRAELDVESLGQRGAVSTIV